MTKMSDVEIRFTQRLLASLRNAVTGALQSFVHDHGPSLEGRMIGSASKRVAHTVQGLLKTHPDIRHAQEKWRDEKCQAECARRGQIIDELKVKLAVHSLTTSVEPDLVRYMTTTESRERDALFLRMYATKLRNGTAFYDDIPNTIASTLEDVAKRLAVRMDSDSPA